MKRKPTKFKNLDALMGKYLMTIQDMAKVIGRTREQTSLKIQGTAKFDIEEVSNILRYFIDKGETITFEQIFLHCMCSNENRVS